MIRYAALILPISFLANSGCETSRPVEPYTAGMVRNFYPIDGISRNVGNTQGGTVHDSYSLIPPPVRKDYSDAR